jgi:hypothetical protein
MSSGVLTLPLLPHHQVVSRRRLEGTLPDDMQIDPLYQGFGVRRLIVFIHRIKNWKSFSSHLAHTDSSPIRTVLCLKTDTLRGSLGWMSSTTADTDCRHWIWGDGLSLLWL